MVARSIRVHGRVQGVGFRWWTRAQAERLGISGTVENAPDGTVLIRAEGSAEALERLQAAVESGPSAAEVVRIEIDEWGGGGERGFRIIH